MLKHYMMGDGDFVVVATSELGTETHGTFVSEALAGRHRDYLLREFSDYKDVRVKRMKTEEVN
jgi:hypothetical protein